MLAINKLYSQRDSSPTLRSSDGGNSEWN